MENPVLVEVTRGPIVESFHRGSVAIVDGAGRASEAAMAAVLIDLLKLTPDDPGYDEMRQLANPPVKSWAGETVGEIRVTGALGGLVG